MVSVTSWFSNGSAYFLNSTQFPSVCVPNHPLTFFNISVFKVSGNISDVFDLNTWQPTNLIPSEAQYFLSVKEAIISSTQTNGSIY